MKTLLKRLKTFCLEKNYLWLNPLNKEKTPDGILIYQDKRKNLFFSAEEFARTLHNLTGRKIYMAQIAHYNMKALHPRGNNTVAWCWRHNRFFYFAPVGGPANTSITGAAKPLSYWMKNTKTATSPL